jgi:transposase-like protein
MIQVAAEVAAKCPSYRAIARSLGVHHCTVRDWVERGEDSSAPELFQRFSTAIHEALLTAEINLTEKITCGEPKDAAWMLTHSPFFREEWSDAAAERRAVQRSQDRTIAVIEAAPELSPDQRRMLFARLAAAGEHSDPASLA